MTDLNKCSRYDNRLIREIPSTAGEGHSQHRYSIKGSRDLLEYGPCVSCPRWLEDHPSCGKLPITRLAGVGQPHSLQVISRPWNCRLQPHVRAPATFLNLCQLSNNALPRDSAKLRAEPCLRLQSFSLASPYTLYITERNIFKGWLNPSGIFVLHSQ